MTESQQSLEHIANAIKELPLEQRNNAIDAMTGIRKFVSLAGHPAGALALAAVGAQAQVELEQSSEAETQEFKVKDGGRGEGE